MKYLLFKEPQSLNNFALKTQEFLFQKQTSKMTLVLLLPFTTTHRADGRVSGMPCCQHEFSLVESFQSDEEPANESPFINHVPIEPHHTKHPNKTKNKQQKKKQIAYLNKELGALDIDDERDRVVDSHTPGPVAFGDKGGEPSTSAVPHGEVNDKVEVVLLQVVHDAALLLFGGTFIAVVLLKRPIDCSHLYKETKQT